MLCQRIFKNHYRYLVIGISLITLTFIFGNPLIFNFTIICMVKDVNGTIVPMFTDNERSWLFSVVAIGNLTATMIITSLIKLLGGRLTCTLYGLISGIATILMPICADIGFIPLIIARIFQGAGAGTSLAGISLVSNAWSPISSMGFIISIISCYVQIGPMYTMPVASYFCESSLSWKFTYYQQGALTLIFSVLFYIIYRDTPRDLGYHIVTLKELQLLEKDKEDTRNIKHQSIPILRIFTDISVYGVILCAFGNLLAQQIFLIYGAIYLNNILDLSVEMTGISALIANIVSLFIKLFMSPVSDYSKCISQKMRAILITTISHFIIAVSFFVLTKIDKTNQLLGQLSYLLTIVFSSLQSVGFMKSNQLANRQFAFVVMSVIACLNCCIVLFLPLFMSIVAPNNSVEEWHTVFWIIGGVVVVTTVIYDLTAKAEPRPWTKINTLNEIKKHQVVTLTLDSTNSNHDKIDTNISGIKIFDEDSSGDYGIDDEKDEVIIARC